MTPQENQFTSVTAVVVNDNSTQSEILAELLKSVKFDVSCYESVESAVLALDPNTPPDIIITDLYMPGIDGWRFCRLLRSPEYKAFNQVPILVVSATFSGDDASRITADVGADAFLPAPIDGNIYIKTVQTLLKRQKAQIVRKVLIIEDSISISTLLQEAFKKSGYHADVALSGKDGLQMFESASYGYVVLDHHLPDLLGDQLLERFSASETKPVCIMITTDPRPDLAVSWMKKGADAYLRKPFDPEFLIKLCAKAGRERSLLRVEKLLEKRTEQLRSSEELYRVTIDSLPEAIHFVDTDLRILLFSKKLKEWCAELGLEQNIIGKNLREVFPFLSQEVFDQYRQAMDMGVPVLASEENVINGRVILTETQKIPCVLGNKAKGILTVLIDVTERKRAEEKIQNLLKEKKLLLQEVHHRIKNNMNVIRGLLLMHAKSLDIPEAVSVLKDAIGRIESMEVLYDKLYRTENFRNVSSKAYFTQLIDEIHHLFPNRESVQIKTKFSKDDTINVGVLFPLGIIINELFTNSMKYAFIGRGGGKIKLSLEKKDHTITIIFEDNGIGIPDNSMEQQKGFGMKLVDILVKQLDGNYQIEKNHGTRYIIELNDF